MWFQKIKFLFIDQLESWDKEEVNDKDEYEFPSLDNINTYIEPSYVPVILGLYIYCLI